MFLLFCRICFIVFTLKPKPQTAPKLRYLAGTENSLSWTLVHDTWLQWCTLGQEKKKVKKDHGVGIMGILVVGK